jgi:hypothetical protein
MKMVVAVLAVMALTVTSTGVAPDAVPHDAAPDPVALTGVVRAATGKPLEGVQVVVEGTSLGTLTGPEGRFRIEGVPAGRQVVSVQRHGYGRQWHEVDATALQGDWYRFTLRSIPPGPDIIPIPIGQPR